ncbi:MULTISPECIES: CvpA family protein [Flavobacterium]|uniref:CvpA family protein n=1 Tax=Flavobacterium covae TaxID=2906076 RepID=A0ABW8PDE1_9FLAO|nr:MULTISPECIES: CvpA family protein [Flavobacterium]OXA80087.1 colicin V production protein [Flavobacterium columnare NBRC 100251 = ATCC 23463]AMA48131.1 colicin V production protein [Flavobacterium covae]MCJ1807778.1 CvpA family protein [Flavobacterium covae]MCJ1809176.1 CvpA family protein [Flavobacterium covae]OWP80121.1 colicin V production protein [Flavobacterium covae]
MGFIDFIIGTLLVFGFYKGFKNGLFVELASLVAFFVGIFIAIKFSYFVSGILEENILWSSKTIQVLAFVITLVLVVLGIHLIAKLLSSIASFAFLGWANTLVGGLFATLKSALLIGVVLNLFQKVNVNDMIVSKETQENSLFFNPCMKTSEILLPVLGDWFADLKEKSDKWDEKTDDVKKQEGQEGIH